MTAMARNIFLMSFSAFVLNTAILAHADIGYFADNKHKIKEYIASDTLHYYIKDYQGNVRSVVRQDGAVVESDEYYPYGGLFSATASVQPYKYGAKELDRTHGLDLYDSEARWYDSLLGRTTTMDPLAEKYYSLSPYTWCAGNPVKYVDPSGKVIYLPNGSIYEYNMPELDLDDISKKMAKALNVVYENGNGLITDLINSSQSYYFTFNDSKSSVVKDSESEYTVNIKLTNDINADVSHESFHCAQYLNGRGGRTIYNEAEAYAFEYYIVPRSIAEQYDPPNLAEIAFNKAFKTLTEGYNKEAFETVIANFKSGSYFNYPNGANSLYSSYKLGSTPTSDSLLKKYLLKKK